MSKKTISKPLTIIMGTAVVGGLTATAAVSAQVTADDNPFAMEDLSSGHLIAGEGEGSCGESKGEDEGEGSCGESKGEDEGEGSCGEGGGDEGEGSCGGATA